jgi:hypothetical protein
MEMIAGSAMSSKNLHYFEFNMKQHELKTGRSCPF